MRYLLALAALLAALPAYANLESYAHPCGAMDCDMLPIPISSQVSGTRYFVLGPAQPWPEPQRPALRLSPLFKPVPVNFNPHGLY